MSESVMVHTNEIEPRTVYLKDYEVPVFLIDEIELHFDLQPDATFVKSHMRIRHNRLSTNPQRDLVLNGEALILEEVKLDGKVLEPSQYHLTDDLLILRQVPDNFELEIKTKIFPDKNTALSGLYRSNQTYCTQCEAEGFRRITYFMDRPDVMSRFTTTIDADAKTYPVLLSNGNLIDSGKSKDGRHWVKWQDPFKKPAYLFALVAGDFDLLEDQFTTQSGRDIVLRVFVEKGYGDQGLYAITALKTAMAWDEKTYGREYDLDVYMIVAIGDFNMGAMENKGLNIFNTKYVLAKPETATDTDYIHILSVVGHEYFHNWTGNRVTCRDWFQLSLKEGLTIFRDQTFTEDTLSAAVMRIREVTMLREVQFPEDAGPLAHPVRPESYIEINNFYTSTVYNKGAEVLRMLQTILGKSLFRKGMDTYFARHDGQAVTIENYIKIMEDVSGIDLTQFRLWYSEIGTPSVTVKEEYDAKAKTYTLIFNQSLPEKKGQPSNTALDIPIRMGLLDEAGKPMVLHLNGEAGETETVLHLKKSSQVFLFKEVMSRPIPSLLRHFSAPIKLHFPYSDKDLTFLVKHDSDAFNRFEAGQQYALRVLLALVRSYQRDEKRQLPAEFSQMYAHILQEKHIDLFLLAEILSLPSEKYLGEQMPVIEVDAIFHAREFVLTELAKQLETLLLQTYRQHHEESKPYQFNMKEVGARQLKNRCLSYLMRLDAHTELGYQQFKQSLQENMTDTQAALTAIANQDLPFRKQALADFYETWKHDALVVDKWLAIQAASKLPHTLNEVKRLMSHEAFDIKNPNKVYALIVTFSQQNLVNFHAKNGEGYVFLREAVQELDKLNPQVAARAVKPLTSWKRYDKERQALMKKQLNILLENHLSKDLYELVTKSLGEV